MKYLFTALLFLFISPALAQEVSQGVSYEQYHSFSEDLDHKSHTIGVDRFLELMQQDDVVILDLRRRAFYDSEHIEGAIHMGADVTAEDLEQVVPTKETTILLYCENSIGPPSRAVALADLTLPQIIMHGYKNTYKLEEPQTEKDPEHWQKQHDRLPWVSGVEQSP